MLLPSEKPSFLHPSSSINSSLISSNGPTSSCIQMTLSHPIMTWKQHHPTWWVTCISRGTASLAGRTTEPMWAPRLVGQPTAQNLNLDLKGRPLQNCWILCLSGNPFRGGWNDTLDISYPLLQMHLDAGTWCPPPYDVFN